MNKNVLITGSSGFIGQHVVKVLKNLDITIHTFLDPPDQDVRDKDSFNFYIDKDIKTVIHLAGVTFIPKSWEVPSLFYSVNFLGTQNVLDYCKKINAKLIYISTYSYGIPEYLPVDEKHSISPNNPYSHSKYLGEEICKFYSDFMGVKTVVIKPFNIYGEGQEEHFLIPLLIKQAKTSDEIVVKDDTPRRDFVNVADLVKAFILALDYDDENFSVFNVGSGESYSVREVIQIISEELGKEIKIKSLGERRKNEVPETIADYTAINKALGWKPEISFRQGIRELIGKK